MGGWTPAAFVAIVVFVGCARVTYEPTVPTRARSADVTVQLTGARFGNRAELAFETRSDTSHQIQSAALSGPALEPCTGGIAPDAPIVDGQEASLLPAGVHRLSVRAPTELLGALTVQDTVLDLRMADGLCVRAPVFSRTAPLSAPDRPLFIWGPAINGHGDVGGLRGIAGLLFGAGRWYGRVLTSITAGVGTAICTEAACGKDSTGTLRSGLGVPAVVEAQYRLRDAEPSKVSIPTLGLRYGFMYARLPAEAAPHDLTIHGLQAAFSWAFAGPNAPPGALLHRERDELVQFTVPVGIVWAPHASEHHVSFVVGFGARMLLPL